MFENTKNITIEGDIKDLPKLNKKPTPAKVVRETIVAKVFPGTKANNLVVYRPNPGETSSSLIIILRENAENFPQVAVGEFWDIEYVQKEGQQFGIGTPIKKSEIESELYITTNANGGNVGMRLFASELGPEDGCIFIMTFPSNRVMNEMRRTLIEEKIEKFKLQAYRKEIFESYTGHLAKLRDDERAIEEIKEAVEVYIKNIEMDNDTAFTNTIQLDLLTEGIVESMNPFDPDTIPEDKDKFIDKFIRENYIVGVEIRENTRHADNGMEITEKVAYALLNVPSSSQVETTEKVEHSVLLD